MRGVVNANTVSDNHLRNEIESMLLESVGMGETGTSDQRERARTFGLGFAPLEGPMDQAERDRVDAEMLAQESVFTRFAESLNHRILKLSDRVDQFITGYKLPDLKESMTKLKDGIAQIPAKAMTAVSSALTHVPRSVAEGINQYLPIAKEQGAKYGVDPIFILAQIWKESTFNPRASSGKAYGLTQFTPDTAREELQQMGVKPDGDLIEFLYKNPTLMIQMQAKRDRDMYDTFKKIAPWAGEEELWDMVLSGYNYGFPGTMGMVKRHGKDWKSSIPGETRDYIPETRKHMGEIQGMLQKPQGPAPSTAPSPEPNVPMPSGAGTWTPEDEANWRKKHGGKPSGVEWTPEDQKKYDKMHGQSSADTYRVTLSANSPDEAYRMVLGAFVRDGTRGLVEMGARRMG
jgi:hypothetical protein